MFTLVCYLPNAPPVSYEGGGAQGRPKEILEEVAAGLELRLESPMKDTHTYLE